MSQKRVHGLLVAALVADGFEQEELTVPVEALQMAGAEVFVVSPRSARVRAWSRGEWGAEYRVDRPLGQVGADEFGAVLVPGGVLGVSRLRMDGRAVDLLRAFRVQRKPIAAISHGPWMIVEAGLAQGLTLTSHPSLKTDVRNAGGRWVNQEVVESDGVVTGRDTEALPAFVAEMLLQFSRARKGERVGEGVPGG
ncbi:MAG: DJ-1/PfpI family protein [Anaerolineae bacterium]|nr:DJ-1/PfpI family protein [Anaerolineae bacterium]